MLLHNNAGILVTIPLIALANYNCAHTFSSWDNYITFLVPSPMFFTFLVTAVIVDLHKCTLIGMFPLAGLLLFFSLLFFLFLFVAERTTHDALRGSVDFARKIVKVDKFDCLKHHR